MIFKWIRKVTKTFEVPSKHIVPDEICIKCGWDTSNTDRAYTGVGTICARCIQHMGGLKGNIMTDRKERGG